MTNLQPTPQSDARRNRLVVIGRALPEVVAEGEPHIAFRVRNKTFAYYEFEHHGNGSISLVCKAPDGAQQGLIDSDPARFFILPISVAKAGLGCGLMVTSSIGMRWRGCWRPPTGWLRPSGCGHC